MVLLTMVSLREMIKKLLLSLGVFAILFSSIAGGMSRPVEAAWYNQSFPEFYARVNNDPPQEIYGERYTYAQVRWVLYSLVAFIIDNIGMGSFSNCMSTGNFTPCVEAVVSGTPVGSNTNIHEQDSLLAEVFQDRPISGVTYVKYKLANVHIIPTANAQGFGYAGIEVVQGLWVTTRNVAYSLFIFVAIVYSFMIMFRVKISPQAVMTVQSSISKITMALILVTFSYAIAGFLIDMMYVAVGIISLIVAGAEGTWLPNNPANLFHIITQGPYIDVLGAELNFGVLGFFVGYIFFFFVTFFVVWFGSGGVVGLIGAAAVGVATGGSSLVIAGIIGVVLAVLLALIFLFLFLKCLWVLFKAFTMILLLTIFAPLYITFGLFSQKLSFMNWMKNFAANLAVFPIMGTLFVLSYVFLGFALRQIGTVDSLLPGGANVGAILSDSLGDLFVGALSPAVGILGIGGSGWPPLLPGGENFLALLYLGASFTIIIYTPKAANIGKSVFLGTQARLESAIGEALAIGGISGLVGGAASKSAQQGLIDKIPDAGQVATALLRFGRNPRRAVSDSVGGFSNRKIGPNPKSSPDWFDDRKKP